MNYKTIQYYIILIVCKFCNTKYIRNFSKILSFIILFFKFLLCLEISLKGLLLLNNPDEDKQQKILDNSTLNNFANVMSQAQEIENIEHAHLLPQNKKLSKQDKILNMSTIEVLSTTANAIKDNFTDFKYSDYSDDFDYNRYTNILNANISNDEKVKQILKLNISNNDKDILIYKVYDK